MEPQEFVRFLYPSAKEVERETGISAAAMIAQAALETGWLKTTVKDRYDGRPSYNLFNLTGEGPAGSVRALDSEHWVGGQRTIEHRFRAYHSYEQSFRDYAKLILEAPRYAQAAAVRWNPLQYIAALRAAGYATDPAYVAKVESVLRKYVWPTMNQIEAESPPGEPS